jgi:hypothetical protein
MASDNTSATKYDAFTSSMISGFPSMIIDRRYVSDPSNAFTDYSNDHTLFGFANLGITATTTGGNVNATVKVEPALNMSGDYRLELVVAEDEVTGSGTGWDQHNYYSGGSYGPLATIGYDFVALPSTVPGVKFPFVARATVPSDISSSTGTPNGVSGSLPSTMNRGNVYSYTFSPVAIQSNWNASKLRVTAMLIDNNPNNATYGYVLNSVNTSSPAFTYQNDAVSNVVAGVEGMVVFPNPAANDAHVRFTLKNASTVNFSVYDVIGREVFTAPAEKMNAGGQQINFSTADLASGMYNVVVRTENGQLTQRLSVVK